MPNLFRTHDGKIRNPSDRLSLTLADGTAVEGVWAGSATEEKLDWHLRQPGSQITQSEPVAAIATKADDNGEIIWGDAPSEARLLFVLLPPATGKNYRLARMVTTAANAAQLAYFRHPRFSLFGQLKPDGTIARIPPPQPPPPPPKAQGELF
jgi:hypothetical protein